MSEKSEVEIGEKLVLVMDQILQKSNIGPEKQAAAAGFCLAEALQRVDENERFAWMVAIFSGIANQLGLDLRDVAEAVINAHADDSESTRH